MSELPALRQFVGAYLHQDWGQEFSSPWDALATFANDEPGLLPSLHGEVHQLLAEEKDEDALRHLLVDELGSGYWPPGDGMSFSEWLSELEERST